NAESVVPIVEGHALDEVGQHFVRRRLQLMLHPGWPNPVKVTQRPLLGSQTFTRYRPVTDSDAKQTFLGNARNVAEGRTPALPDRLRRGLEWPKSDPTASSIRRLSRQEAPRGFEDFSQKQELAAPNAGGPRVRRSKAASRRSG